MIYKNRNSELQNHRSSIVISQSLTCDFPFHGEVALAGDMLLQT